MTVESRCCTVTATDEVTDPLATITCVIPLLCAVTRPLASTVATEGSEDVHRTSTDIR